MGGWIELGVAVAVVMAVPRIGLEAMTVPVTTLTVMTARIKGGSVPRVGEV